MMSREESLRLALHVVDTLWREQFAAGNIHCRTAPDNARVADIVEDFLGPTAEEEVGQTRMST